MKERVKLKVPKINPNCSWNELHDYGFIDYVDLAPIEGFALLKVYKNSNLEILPS